jgi:hypothetical protein
MTAALRRGCFALLHVDTLSPASSRCRWSDPSTITHERGTDELTPLAGRPLIRSFRQLALRMYDPCFKSLFAFLNGDRERRRGLWREIRGVIDGEDPGDDGGDHDD